MGHATFAASYCRAYPGWDGQAKLITDLRGWIHNEMVCLREQRRPSQYYIRTRRTVQYRNFVDRDQRVCTMPNCQKDCCVVNNQSAAAAVAAAEHWKRNRSRTYSFLFTIQVGNNNTQEQSLRRENKTKNLTIYYTRTDSINVMRQTCNKFLIMVSY